MWDRLLSRLFAAPLETTASVTARMNHLLPRSGKPQDLLAKVEAGQKMTRPKKKTKPQGKLLEVVNR